MSPRRERVVEGGQLVAVKQFLCPRMVSVFSAGIAPALPYFVPRLLQDLLVRRVFHFTSSFMMWSRR